MGGRLGVARKIPEEQCAIAGANIRTLRQRDGWSQFAAGANLGHVGVPQPYNLV
jgi:hypothetical protein